jgi:hypothetical protein
MGFLHLKSFKKLLKYPPFQIARMLFLFCLLGRGRGKGGEGGGTSLKYVYRCPLQSEMKLREYLKNPSSKFSPTNQNFISNLKILTS